MELGVLEEYLSVDVMKAGGRSDDPIEALILDLLEWIGPDPRRYSEVIEAWRTSCPRLPVWEEATSRGFIERRHAPGNDATILVTPLGRAFLDVHRSDES
jgi:D-3-phosphoglycerate dehydrogenase